jgi:hypothetical protein
MRLQSKTTGHTVIAGGAKQSPARNMRALSEPSFQEIASSDGVLLAMTW